MGELAISAGVQANCRAWCPTGQRQTAATTVAGTNTDAVVQKKRRLSCTAHQDLREAGPTVAKVAPPNPYWLVAAVYRDPGRSYSRVGKLVNNRANSASLGDRCPE